MSDRRGDEIVRRAAEAAAQLPAADRAAIARIVQAAARARESDREPNEADLLPASRPRTLRAPLVAAIAVAAAVIGFVAGARALGRDALRPAAPAGAATAATPAAFSPREAEAELRIPTTFVLERAHARHVRLVGDFSGWEAQAIPLEREAGSSLWSVTVPLPPGRHVYAFMVDSVWTVDPRAPTTRDPDFGVTGSVVIVGQR